MRILLDECVPRRLKREFTGHDVWTVPEMGWSGRRNGELLQLMLADRFALFITVDQNLSYQQNLRAAGIAVIVLVAVTNRLDDLLPLVPAVLVRLGSISAGEFIEITT